MTRRILRVAKQSSTIHLTDKIAVLARTPPHHHTAREHVPQEVGCSLQRASSYLPRTTGCRRLPNSVIMGAPVTRSGNVTTLTLKDVSAAEQRTQSCLHRGHRTYSEFGLNSRRIIEQGYHQRAESQRREKPVTASQREDPRRPPFRGAFRLSYSAGVPSRSLPPIVAGLQ